MEHTKPADLISFRPFEPLNDLAFVISTWTLGLFDRNFFFRPLNEDLYFKCYEPFLKKVLLSLHPTSILMACLKEDPTVILGYSIIETVEEKPVLHWIHVKKIWRDPVLSIADRLLHEQGASHLREMIDQFREQLKLRRHSIRRIKGTAWNKS